MKRNEPSLQKEGEGCIEHRTVVDRRMLPPCGAKKEPANRETSLSSSPEE
jgi:hypothetical protein